MITVKEAIAIVKGRRVLTEEEEQAVTEVLVSLNDQVNDFKKIAATEKKLIRQAMIRYKRANPAPAFGPLSLSELLEWLLNRARVKEFQAYQRVLEYIRKQLNDLGELSFDEGYTVSGYLLIDLRTRVINILRISEP